jgi:uncharacterized Zn finger protein
MVFRASWSWTDLTELNFMKIVDISHAARTPSLDAMRAFLSKQDKEALVNLAMDVAAKNATFFNKLVLRIARCGAGGPDFAAFRSAVDRAVDTYGHIECDEVPGYADGLRQVVDSLRLLLEDDYVLEVVNLVEYAVARIEDEMECVDDTSSEIGGVLETLTRLHFDACARSALDAEILADRIYDLEMRSEYAFHGSIVRYADILGTAGIAAYGKRVKRDWDHLPALAPGDKDPEKCGRRARLERMMEWLARHAGDLDALIAVRNKDLSNVHAFISLVNIYRETGRDDEALACAERAMASFHNALDTEIADLLVSLYRNAGRHDAAMDILWRQFERRPYLCQFQHLQEYAEPIGSWPPWRKRALSHLHAHVDSTSGRHSRSSAPHLGRPELVRILLWDGDLDAAWIELQKGGCSNELWVRVAEAREETHPDDALRVYRDVVNRVVAQTSNGVYDEPIRLIHRTRAVLRRQGRERAFVALITHLRQEFRRKRNFVRALDEIEVE